MLNPNTEEKHRRIGFETLNSLANSLAGKTVISVHPSAASARAAMRVSAERNPALATMGNPEIPAAEESDKAAVLTIQTGTGMKMSQVAFPASMEAATAAIKELGLDKDSATAIRFIMRAKEGIDKDPMRMDMQVKQFHTMCGYATRKILGTPDLDKPGVETDGMKRDFLLEVARDLEKAPDRDPMDVLEAFDYPRMNKAIERKHNAAFRAANLLQKTCDASSFDYVSKLQGALIREGFSVRNDRSSGMTFSVSERALSNMDGSLQVRNRHVGTFILNEYGVGFSSSIMSDECAAKVLSAVDSAAPYGKNRDHVAKRPFEGLPVRGSVMVHEVRGQENPSRSVKEAVNELSAASHEVLDNLSDPGRAKALGQIMSNLTGSHVTATQRANPDHVSFVISSSYETGNGPKVDEIRIALIPGIMPAISISDTLAGSPILSKIPEIIRSMGSEKDLLQLLEESQAYADTGRANGLVKEVADALNPPTNRGLARFIIGVRDKIFSKGAADEPRAEQRKDRDDDLSM